MNRRKFIALGASAGITLPLTSCGSKYSGTYKYEFSVTIDTPNGPMTASSIYEHKIRENWGPIAGLSQRFNQYYDADSQVFVLEDGRVLVALLEFGLGEGDVERISRSPSPEIFLFHVLLEEDRYKSFLIGNFVHYDAEYYPTFVVFDDPSDPSSFTYFRASHMGRVLGEGYEVSEVGVRKVSEGDVLNPRLEQHLPWLGDFLVVRNISDIRLFETTAYTLTHKMRDRHL